MHSMSQSNFIQIAASPAGGAFGVLRRRYRAESRSTMSAPCSSRTTAGSTIGGAAKRAERKRHTRSGADGDDPQGIRLQEQRQAAAHQAARLHPLDSASRPHTAIRRRWTAHGRNTSGRAGRSAARRTNFADAVDFVGWYHAKTADTYGIARNDAYNLYLAYYFGWTGYNAATGKRIGVAALRPRDQRNGPEIRSPAQAAARLRLSALLFNG